MTKQERPSGGRPRDAEGGNNRVRLIDAATRVLAEQGYEATTVKAIAAAAGVSPGLFHYYFVSKDELLVEVVKEAESRFTPVIEPLRAQVPPSQVARAGLAATRARVDWQPEWYRLRYELFALGLRKPDLLPAVRALLASGRSGIGGTLRASAPSPEATGDAEVEAVAAILLACFDGLALQRLADPDFDLDAAYVVLGRMIRSLLAADP